MTDPRPLPHIDELLAEAAWARSLARAIVGNDADADDVMQSAWLDALRSAPPEPGKARGWLRTVVKRTAFDLRRGEGRRRRREGAGAIQEDAPSSSDVPADRAAARIESQKLLLAAVESLGPLEREVVVLRYFDDIPPRRIAARLGVSADVVKSRLRRAKEHLRAELARRGVRSDADLRFALGPLFVLDLAAAPRGSAATSGTGAARRVPEVVAAVGAICLVLAIALVALWGVPGTSPAATGDGGASGSGRAGDGTALRARHRNGVEPTASDAHDAGADAAAAGSATARDRRLDVEFDPAIEGLEFAMVREHRAGADRALPWRRVRLEDGRLPLAWSETDGDAVVAIDVRVDHPRRSRRSVRISPAEESGGALTLRIPPAVPVHGTATAAAGPGGAVVVYAFPAGGDSAFSHPEDSCAADSGAPFELRLRDGVDYRVIALAEDCVPAECMVRAADGADAGALACGPGLTISGSIERVGFGAEAGPLTLMFERAGVVRSLMLPDGAAVGAFEDGTLARRVGFAPVAPDGSFRVAGLAGGVHRLSVTARDTTLLGCVLEPSAELTPSQDPVELLLRGTEVELLAPGLSDGTLVFAQADNVVASTGGRVSGGRCNFIAPPGVNLTFWAGKGALSRSVERPPGHATSRVELAEPSIAFVDVVLDCAGESGPGGATCELRAEDGRRLFVTEPAEFVDGRAVVRVPDVGRAELIVRPWTRREARHRDWWVPDVRKLDTGMRPVLRLSPKQGGRLAIISRDAEGRPITGRVRLTGPAGEVAVQCELRHDGAGMSAGPYLGPEGVTDVVDPVPPGRYQVAVTATDGRDAVFAVTVERGTVSAAHFSWK